MSDKLPAVPQRPLPRDLIKEMAMDIGKAVVTHIEIMYPKAVAAVASTFTLSVRNCVHNEIIAAIGTSDPDEIAARLAERKISRRQTRAAYKRLREDAEPPTTIADVSDTFVLMPREPTPELLAAFQQCKKSGGSDDEAYRAMINAVQNLFS